jgi:hypothetical protein
MTDSVPETAAPRHRGLLALVVVLGVLFLLALIGVIVAIALRARGAGASAAPASYAAGVAAPGEHLEGAQLDGARILLRFSGAASGDELVILDAGSGRIVGRIAIGTAR